MPLLLHQQFDRRLVGSSTAPRGVRIISVIFAVLSATALAIFIISILRNLNGPPLIVKIGRLALPLIVLAGAYMIRRFWHSGFWIFGAGVLLWFLVLTRSLLIMTNKSISSLILVGALWCFTLGTLIYLAKIRNIFLSSVPPPAIPQSILPTALPIEIPIASSPAAQESALPQEKVQNETPPRSL